MKPAAVTESLLHDLVMSSAAEGTGQTAVAAAVTLGERILLCGHDTRDFDREWDLPGGMPLPGETLTSALSRILACGYGLDATEFGAYLGSHDIVHDGEIIRTFVFTATCADPMQICQHARIAHCWADPADLPEQASQDLAHLADIAMLAAAAPSSSPPGQCQVTAALRAWSKGIYCDEAATELLIRHRPGCAGTTSSRSSSSPRPGRPGTSPQQSAGKRQSPPSRQETCPAQAAKPPSSAWPPASPAHHPSTCETSSPDSTRPTSTSSSTR
jgi:ADP-ribose pyrophosphatase YjhB (NUDIX family)